MAEMHAEMTVMAANKAVSPSVIEDYTRPVPPRSVPDPPWMKVPTMRDMGLR
jgi:hypothetical protein